VEELLSVVLVVALVVVYIALLPAILLIATPFVLLWPGGKLSDGTRAPRRVGQRYLKILKLWMSFAQNIC
jgi:hypothetical protein